MLNFPSGSAETPIEGLVSESERLERAGVHLHFPDKEIEAKLDITKSENSSEEILQALRKRLEESGYSFTSSPIDVRENYVTYYAERGGRKGKIIARNRGEAGFQVKQKSIDSEDSSSDIIVKNESESDVFANIKDAESYLAERMGVAEVEKYIASRIVIKKFKFTMMAVGDDSVTRFFRLIVDESNISGDEFSRGPGDRLRQIEIEYKGSDQEVSDKLPAVCEQMNKIIAAIMSEASIAAERTVMTKRKWSSATDA